MEKSSKETSFMSGILLYILLGVVAGVLSGMIGLGGGIIIIPALVFWFGFSQHLAQGTTLAMMVPPIGILAAWTYYQQGYADLKVALLIGLGFFIGGLFGAKIATNLPNNVLQKIFGAVLLIISLKMIFNK